MTGHLELMREKANVVGDNPRPRHTQVSTNTSVGRGRVGTCHRCLLGEPGLHYALVRDGRPVLASVRARSDERSAAFRVGPPTLSGVVARDGVAGRGRPRGSRLTCPIGGRRWKIEPNTQHTWGSDELIPTKVGLPL